MRNCYLISISREKVNLSLKAMDQLNHVTSVITITVCKFIKKLITEIDFWYKIDLNRTSKKVCLVPKIHFSHEILNNLTYPGPHLLVKLPSPTFPISAMNFFDKFSLRNV